jgi:hypothetical protein
VRAPATQATPDDLNANAEFIRNANAYVEVPGGKNSNNYANVKLIVDIAVRPPSSAPLLRFVARHARCYTRAAGLLRARRQRCAGLRRCAGIRICGANAHSDAARR